MITNHTRMQSTLRTIAACTLLALLCGPAVAADEKGGKDAQAADLAKQVQNPLANLVTLPLQFNYNKGVDTGPAAGGDLEGGRTFFRVFRQPCG